MPQLFAGNFYVALRQMRGQPWSFADFFAGFRYWVPLFIIGALSQFAYWLCFLPVSVVTLAFHLLQDSGNPDSTMAFAYLGLVVILASSAGGHLPVDPLRARAISRSMPT